MNHYNEKYNQIEDYIHGRLSGQSLTEFEDVLKYDQELAMEVKMHQVAEELVVGYKLNDLRKELKEIAARERNNNWKLYSLGGIILATAIIISSYFLLFNTKEETITKISPTTKTFSTYKEADSKNGSIIESLSQSKTPNESIRSTIAPNYLMDSANTILPITQQPTIVAKESENNYLSYNSSTIKKEETIANEENTIFTPTDPCKNISLQIDIETKGSCKDQESGLILIESNTISGGKEPYRFSLNNELFQSSAYFPNLSSGTYTIYIKDNNNCVIEKQTKVYEIECKSEYAFNPSRGEVWNIPMIDESELSLKIHDRSGRIVYEKIIYNENQITWDGRTTNNEDLPMGNYSFVLTGKNGKTKIGYISIFH